jgi:hypothetical protein
MTTTEVTPASAPLADAPAEPAFFSVGLAKLAIMSLVTFGLYELFWSYRNWKCARKLTGESLNAPIRAFFYPVTSYFLFRRIEDCGLKYRILMPMNTGTLAFVFFLLSASWRLPDPIWLASNFSFVPLLAIQSAVNEINARVAPGADPNRRLGAWNIVAILVGGAMLCLVVAGLFVEPAPQ